MELREANKILQTVKTAFAADGKKIVPSLETDGLLMLLDKLDSERYLAPKLKQLRAAAKDSPAYNRLNLCITFFRALSAVRAGISQVTVLSLSMFNRELCSDAHPDAGKLRTSGKLTDGSEHTDPKYISGSLKAIITKMKDIPPSPTTDKDTFCGYLTHYMRELIIMHPFDCDSPLTVRLFLAMFAQLKGFTLAYNRVPPATIRSAESDALLADDVTPLYKMLHTCLSYDHTVLAQPRKQRTRREASNNVDKAKETQKQIEGVKTFAERDDYKNMDEAKLHRIVKLQQKISRLNEQLTELTTTNPKDKD